MVRKNVGGQQRKGVLLSLLFLLVLMGSAFGVQATHFRGGTLTWQQNGGNSIRFTMNTSWRRGYFTNLGSSTNVGTTVNLGSVLNFGDGNGSSNIIATVTSSDPVTDIITTTYIVDHTYTNTGTYTAKFNGCCRISTLLDNNHDVNYILTTSVNVGGSPLNNPPVSALPPIVNIPINSTSNLFTIPATDPDGDPITFRLATPAESGLSTASPSGFTLNANGTFSMNTTGRSTTNTFAIQFMMEDHVGTTTGTVKSKVPVDLLIQMVPFSNPPVFVSPTPLSPNNTFSVLPGNAVTFSVSAQDPDAGQNVTLNPVSIPLGAAMTPALPVVGPTNGTATSAFSWTPTAGQVGTNVVNFVASDNLGVQAVTSVSITVLCALNATAAITQNTCIGQSNGAIDVTVTNASSAANLSYIWSGPNSFSASTQDVTGLSAGSYTLRIDDNATGCFTIKNYVITNTLTITPVASSNTPVCEGGTLNLSGSGASNLSWSGPNSYSSTNGNSSITNVPTTSTGTYTLTATDGATGCTASTTTDVVINPTPAIPIITADGPTTFCSGSSVTLSSHTPAHTTTFLIAGGSATGAPVSCDCEPGSVAVGYKGRTGSWMDQFQFACKHLNNDGSLGSTVTYTSANGTSNGGGPVSDILFSGTNSMVGLDADAFTSIYGTFIKGITGYGQTTAYIGAAGTNNSGYTSLAAMVGGGLGGGTSSHLGTLFVPNGNVVVGMSSYNNDGYSKGVALHYNTIAEVTGADLTWSNSSTGPSITVSTAGSFTVTVTNEYGCTATSVPTTTTVNTAPTIVCPANIATSADLGICGAVVTYADITTTGMPAPTVSYSQASATNFPVGLTTVTATANNVCGSVNCSFDITVTDNEAPVVTCPSNVTVSCSADNSPSSTGVATAVDNCGITNSIAFSDVSTQDNDANVCGHYSYVITRTWSVIDIHNNLGSCLQTITVQDNTAPTFTAPPAATIYTDAACTYDASPSVTGDVSNEQDNCSTGLNATYTDVVTDGTCAGSKVITRTWSLVDKCGNAAADQTQIINVNDNTPPSITCPSDIVACDDQSGNSKTLSMIASDNCSTTTTTYTLGGVASGSGSGNTLTRNFDIGTTYVYWTVKDACNNTSVCTTTVLIRALPIASITSSDANSFCNSVDLTGNSSDAGSTYAWTYANASFANTQIIRLKVGNSDGLYTLKVTNSFGCTSNGITYNFQKQTLASMYVLIGFKEVDLNQNNDVYNGSVGVTSSHGEAEFDKYCSVASPGAFVKAYDIDVKSNVTIPTKISSPAIVTLPTMLLNTASLTGLSNYTKTSSGTVTGNYRDLTINSGKTVTITGNIFRKIKIKKECDVTFTASDISIESLDIEKDCNIHFTGNTNFRATDKVDIDKNCSINPEGKRVTFYIKDPSTSSYSCWNNYSYWRHGDNGNESFVVDGQSTTVIANVYVPDGKIRVHGNGHSCNWNNNESCSMTGLFIAEEIESDGKNVNWYSYDCASHNMRLAGTSISTVEEATEHTVMIYPNPTSGQFTIQFSEMTDPATVVITDIAGRVVEQKTVPQQSSLSTTFDLSGKSAGVYLIQIKQGDLLQRFKLIMK